MYSKPEIPWLIKGAEKYLSGKSPQTPCTFLSRLSHISGS